MSKPSIIAVAISVASVAAGLMVSASVQAQTLDAAPAESALPLPLSITQRYVPQHKESQLPRAPLTLLVGDSPVVAAAPPPVVVDEVGDRPAIAALARGRLAITVWGTVSGTVSGTQRR